MVLHHHVPARRLTLGYFRRWWFWKGLSRSRLERRHPITELGLDLSRVARLAGIPRFMVGSAARAAAAWLAALLSGDIRSRVRHEMMLCYFAGYVRGSRLPDRDSPADGRRPVRHTEGGVAGGFEPTPAGHPNPQPGSPDTHVTVLSNRIGAWRDS